MAREHGVQTGSPRRRGRLAAIAASALAAEYVPSVVALGQWGPLDTLPGGLCRWRGPRFPPRVALTFDDGPDPEGTPKVLDALDELDLRATFFVVGERVRTHPDLVAETARRGHLLASHGDRHVHHFVHSPSWVLGDLRRSRESMAAIGHIPRWYRPPYGQATGATLAAARAMGLRTVLWSAWGREWASQGSCEVARRVTRRLRPGAVVLLHDSDRFGRNGMWRLVVEALPELADELRRRRLSAVTIDELVG
jgi:peptidoglycan-N-acetylglucosamine deacetylase